MFGCFDVVVSFNYDTIFEESLPGKHRWKYEGLEDCKDAMRILKPHGSINWSSDGTTISRAKQYERSVIVAPTHLKFISGPGGEDPDTGYAGYLDQAPQIQSIWQAMEREMKEARVLVFIGYSFPPSDLYFSSLLRSVLAVRSSAPAIVVVNPDAVAIGKRLQQRFAVGTIIRYFDMVQFAQTTRNKVFSQLD